MTQRRAWVVFLLVLGGAACAAVLGRGAVLPALARWLDAGGPPREADYALVLPGDENVRPFVAAAMLKAGLVRAVLVPQTESGPDEEDRVLPPTHEINRQVLLRRGVPAERIIVLRGQSASTLSDLEALGQFLADRPEARVCLVTNHYHTRRAGWAVARTLGARAGQVSVVSCPADGFAADNWWRSQAGFLAVAGEYCKLGYFALRYTPLPFAVLGVAAGCAAARWLHSRRSRRRSGFPARRRT